MATLALPFPPASLLPTAAPRAYRPEIAFPAELEQEHAHFASGVNHPGEVRGLALSGRHVGITCGEIRTGLLAELEQFGAPGPMCLFVDSRAFSEVKFSKATGRLEIVKPITDDQWAERFELYTWAARTFRIHAYVVAPDCVGNQTETLRRLQRFAPEVAAVAALRAHIIVPVQKGELPMSAMFARACELLGLREAPIAGIPMKKDATSLADLAELVDSMPWYGCRFHLLGLGPESKRFAAAIRCIRSRRPNAMITSDSVTVRRLVGRTNGRKGQPRAITKYHDEARATGYTDPIAVKEYALERHGDDEYQQTLERAHAAGWYDTELFDSLDEAKAFTAARRDNRGKDC